MNAQAQCLVLRSDFFHICLKTFIFIVSIFIVSILCSSRYKLELGLLCFPQLRLMPGTPLLGQQGFTLLLYCRLHASKLTCLQTQLKPSLSTQHCFSCWLMLIRFSLLRESRLMVMQWFNYTSQREATRSSHNHDFTHRASLRALGGLSCLPLSSQNESRSRPDGTFTSWGWAFEFFSRKKYTGD